MTPTQQTQDEADRVDLVYSYVLSQMGAKTISEVLALWQSVPAGQAAQTASAWLARATASILKHRGKARELGLAYYRLARALRTGTTIADPLNEEPEVVSLEMLRQEFEALVADVTGDGSTEVTADTSPASEDDSIETEAIDLSDALAADESGTPEYVETTLKEMAEHASAKVEAIPEDTDLKSARAATKDMHAQHGAMVAATAARIAMNGAKHVTNRASQSDPKVKGWVRQSSTGTPCYWCAMLISRQVLYKSKASAGDGIFKYHDNCHCVAVPVYSDADYKTNPKYAENRRYWALWEQYIKGKFGGNEALNEWRKLLARIRANEKKPAAQAAA